MLVLECEKTGTRYELGYGGFEMLRWKVAQIHGKALRKVQDAFTTPLFAYMADGRKQFYMKHLKGALCRMQANGEISEGVARFIGQPYCKGTLSAKNCNEIYEKIKGYEDELNYALADHSEMHFQDFSALLKECAANNAALVWSDVEEG